MNGRFKNRIKSAAFGIGIVTAIVGCGKGGSTKTWLIDPKAVSEGGCLNMERLTGAMAGFPEETVGRRYTYDLNVNGDGGSNGNGLILMARGNFKYEDRPARQLMDFYHASQNGCSTVSLIDDDGHKEDFKIKDGGDGTVTFTNEQKTVKIKLLDTTTMTVSSDLAAADPCNNEIGARIQKTEVFRWGGPDVFERSTEKVKPGMLAVVARSTDVVPEGIRGAMTANSDEVDVSITDLRALRNSEVRTDVMACWPPPPPPIDPPTLPDDRNGSAHRILPLFGTICPISEGQHEYFHF